MVSEKKERSERKGLVRRGNRSERRRLMRRERSQRKRLVRRGKRMGKREEIDF